MPDLDAIRHSCAHLLAAAVQQLFSDVKLGIGPVIEDGFYYDFDLAHTFTPEDFPKIEKFMQDLVKKNLQFERQNVTPAEAKKIFKDQPYKLDLIDEFSKEGKELTIYKTGDFLDLCKGGHVQSTKEIGAFKLLRVAGAYWRGDSKNKQLQRIYATAFPSKKELDAYTAMLAEAEKRDHKKLGKELDLFMQSEIVGKGLPIWLPKGETIKRAIEQYAITTETKAGYVRVATPHLAKKELFEKSGHLPYYKESMYPPMTMDDGVYYLKAMNCPIHHLIYNHKQRSYRELPLRIAEYGTVYRNELSGTLAGLLRTRMLGMNDAHIYCTKDQIAQEFEAVMTMILHYYKTFGLTDYWFRLSLHDPNNKEKYIDEPENWRVSEDILRKVLKKLNVKFTEAHDEAAFYGPKVDIQYKAVTGREETMSTIQLDFAAKKRFDLSYVDIEGRENKDVYVIHRAPLSTHERFISFLIEHFSGKFPVWLAPVQVVLLTVADRHVAYAEHLRKALEEHDIRVELDARPESIPKKVRDHQLQKIPLMVVLGDKEVEKNTVAARTLDGKTTFGIKKEDFVKKTLQTIQEKTIKIVFSPSV